MFGRRSRETFFSLLLATNDQGSVHPAKASLTGRSSPFDLDIVTTPEAMEEKLGTERYDCLLIDPAITHGKGPRLTDLIERIDPETAIVLLWHTHAGRRAGDLEQLSSVAFLDARFLLAPELVEKLDEAIQVARAARTEQLDALLVPGETTVVSALSSSNGDVYRALIETSQQGVLTVDPAGWILFTNQRLGEMMECHPDELLGWDIMSFIQDGDGRRSMREALDAAFCGSPSRCELAFGPSEDVVIPVLASVSGIGDAMGGPGSVSVSMTDISEERRLRERLEELAITDPLTGMRNVRHLDDSFKQECSRTKRYHRPLSILLIDVDGLSAVNDAHGRRTGDRVLRHVAEIISGAVRDTDLVSRLGGDEFCLLLPETDYDGAGVLAKRLGAQVPTQPIELQDQALRVTVSIGFTAMRGDTPIEPDQLVSRADLALRRAKEAGPGNVHGIAPKGPAHSKKCNMCGTVFEVDSVRDVLPTHMTSDDTQCLGVGRSGELVA